jgi:hypothetical protein
MIPKFPKQPREIIDVDFSFVAWKAMRPSAVYSAHEVTVETGMTVEANTHVSGVVKITLGGGTDGTKYKVTCRYFTSGLVLVNELECTIVVKET